jgi:vacuolar-type H+-ATPase subunit H
MEAVKEAESKAEAIIKAAADSGRELVEKAKADAQAQQASSVQEAKEAAKQQVLKAKDAGEQFISEKRTQAQSETEALKAAAKSRYDEAVNLIIKELV